MTSDRVCRIMMAERMSIKRGENYSSAMSFLRRRFRFFLSKTILSKTVLIFIVVINS